MSKPDNEEPFLSRWSRMKRRTGADKPTEVPAPQPLDECEGAPDADAAIVGAEKPLDLSTLPRVEELTEHSDIAAFLDKRVPAILRNAALSRIWTLDPTIRDFIEIAENQWNWNIPGGAPFYEEILPGSTSGTLIADATSAIYRTLGDTAETAPVASADASLVENDIQQSVEQATTNHVALQQSNVMGATDEATATLCQTPEPPDALATPQTDDAAQQSVHDVAPNRRRHGGALPA